MTAGIGYYSKVTFHATHCSFIQVKVILTECTRSDVLWSRSIYKEVRKRRLFISYVTINTSSAVQIAT